MSPKIVIEYVPFPGRAEAARAAFRYGNIQFEDRHISFEGFAENKGANKYLLGQIPVLYVDDVQYVQSGAIAAYAGRLANIYPVDAQKALIVDEALHTWSDLSTTSGRLYTVSDADLSTCLTELAPTFAKLQKYISTRVGSGKYVSGEFSVADIALFYLIEHWKTRVPDLKDTPIDKYYHGLRESEHYAKFSAKTN